MGKLLCRGFRLGINANRSKEGQTVCILEITKSIMRRDHGALVFRQACQSLGRVVMKGLEAGVEGAVWSETVLDRFLEDPRGYLPGTSMVFRGVRGEDNRADLIAYLLEEGGPAEAPAEISEDAGPSPEIAAILAIEGDLAYGEYLSSECTACHLSEGGDGIPSIAGVAPSVFIMGLTAYRSEEREHPVMNMVAARLGDEEIAALAAYFASAGE